MFYKHPFFELGSHHISNGIQIPWTTPPVISGFLVSRLSGSILQIGLIAIDIVIYTPFLTGSIFDFKKRFL